MGSSTDLATKKYPYGPPGAGIVLGRPSAERLAAKRVSALAAAGGLGESTASSSLLIRLHATPQEAWVAAGAEIGAHPHWPQAGQAATSALNATETRPPSCTGANRPRI